MKNQSNPVIRKLFIGALAFLPALVASQPSSERLKMFYANYTEFEPQVLKHPDLKFNPTPQKRGMLTNYQNGLIVPDDFDSAKKYPALIVMPSCNGVSENLETVKNWIDLALNNGMIAYSLETMRNNKINCVVPQDPAMGGGDISGLTLANLVSSGHLRLGGIGLSGISSLTVDENTAQLGGLGLFGSVVLTAEGGVYAQGFNGGNLRVSLDRAYAEEHWAVSARNGVTVAGTTVSVDGTAVATVDATANGQGTDLLLSFNFSGSSLTAAQQAAVVERVAHAIDYTNAGSTPPDYARAVKLTVSDGSATAVDATLLTVTPVTDTEVLGGVRTITGTTEANTLSGSVADETFVGYGGPVGNAGTSNATGDTLTGGGGADTFVYRMANVGKDVITDFGVRGVAGILTANEDVINIHDLLKGYVSGTSDSNDYVRLVDNGTSVSVKVDFNGKADGSVFQSYMEVQLSGVTLSNTGATDVDALRMAMITHGQLVL